MTASPRPHCRSRRRCTDESYAASAIGLDIPVGVVLVVSRSLIVDIGRECAAGDTIGNIVQPVRICNAGAIWEDAHGLRVS